MKVTRTSRMSGVNTMDLDVTQEQLDRFARREGLIQNIFPNLTPPEREFILTGYTQADWEKMFPPEEK